MTLDSKQLWMWLALTAVITVIAMTIGAMLPNQQLTVLGATMFALVAMVVGWIFAGMANKPPTGENAGMGEVGNLSAVVSARFGRLIGTAWLWAGSAMMSCYYLTDQQWQHAWQYGLAMLLIGAAVWWWAKQRLDADSAMSGATMVRVARILTALQGTIAVVGVLVLAMSDKVDAADRDWAANVVFIAAGLTVFSLSMSALRAERLIPKA